MMRTFLIGTVVLAGLFAAGRCDARQPANPVPPSWTELKVREPVPIDRSSIAGEGNLPVIIIPELGCDETTYADFAKRYARRFTTHTLVLPGSVKDSKSPTLERGQVRDPEWLVNAVDAVRNYAIEHKLEKPLIIGQGIGGTVAYMLAIREPELAMGYVVINALPAPSIGGPGRIPLTEQRGAEVDKLERSAILAMTPASWANRTRTLIPMQTTDAKRAEALLAVIPFAPINAIRRYSLEPLYLDLREDLDGAKSQILVYLTLPEWVRDNDKAMLRAAFQNVAYNRPNVRTAILEDARQWAILDDPDKFDPPLMAFLGIEDTQKSTATPETSTPETTVPEKK
ncbi:MAG: alpha/beta hydrolase [Phycisphaeraceae bacterium]|nr:alpha/beta hydrolase [Phycisphaeraceae bacterium]